MFPMAIDKKWAIYQARPAFVGGPMVSMIRVAFADTLKEQTAKEIGWPYNRALESNKDQVVRDEKTFRDCLIEVVARERKGDPLHWVKLAVNGTSEMFAVTGDISMRNDTFRDNGYKVTTFRVFRTDFHVPDPNDTTEGSLDRVSTDHLVVPAKDHSMQFSGTCSLFPQYKNCRPSLFCHKVL